MTSQARISKINRTLSANQKEIVSSMYNNNNSNWTTPEANVMAVKCAATLFPVELLLWVSLKGGNPLNVLSYLVLLSVSHDCYSFISSTSSRIAKIH